MSAISTVSACCTVGLVRPDYWALAAMAGRSRMEDLDAEADARGEESQDPEDWK